MPAASSQNQVAHRTSPLEEIEEKPSTSIDGAPDFDVEENDFRIVVSTKNQWNSEYITKMLMSKFDGVEVETLPTRKFEKVFGYRPPYMKFRRNTPRRQNAAKQATPSEDKITEDFFVCQICGEQVTAVERPEWAVKTRHALTHLKHDARFKCYLCGFVCNTANPMYHHMPIAHNNKMQTDLYPLFGNERDIEIFNKCVSDCFPKTTCLSALERLTDRSQRKNVNVMYFNIVLGEVRIQRQSPQGETMGPVPVQIVVPAMTAEVQSVFPSEIVKKEADLIQLTTSKDGLQLTCGFCDYRTKSASFMEDHVKLSHTTVQKVACDVCGYEANNRRLLKDHKDIFHADDTQEPTIPCAICGYVANCRRILIDHIKIAHGDEAADQFETTGSK